MYLFKQDTLRDGVIDAKEIDQWRQILSEYEESLKEITSPKHEKKIDKENTKTNQSTNTKNKNARIINPTIYLNPPAYEFNKKKNNFLLKIWKHETGIKINFDLWKP